jgi:hypothetical protein
MGFCEHENELSGSTNDGQLLDYLSNYWNCTTNRQVAGSIPDGVTRTFHCHNPSGRTMALGSTQPLTEMSTVNNFWEVKAAGA